MARTCKSKVQGVGACIYQAFMGLAKFKVCLPCEFRPVKLERVFDLMTSSW